MSSADSASALKFFDAGTQAFEAELGLTINEPGTYAVKSATELAVVELIKEGARKGVWDFKYPLVENKFYQGAGFQPEPPKEDPKPVVVVQPTVPVVTSVEPKEVPVTTPEVKAVPLANRVIEPKVKREVKLKAPRPKEETK
jgi:hypothetical protein